MPELYVKIFRNSYGRIEEILGFKNVQKDTEKIEYIGKGGDTATAILSRDTNGNEIIVKAYESFDDVTRNLNRIPNSHRIENFKVYENLDCVSNNSYVLSNKAVERAKEFSTYYTLITKNILKSIKEKTNNKNFVVAPFSILVLLMILADATAGNTKNEIVKILSEQKYFEKLKNIYEMRIIFSGQIVTKNVNALIVKNVEVKNNIATNFVEILKSRYNGEIYTCEDIKEVGKKEWVKAQVKEVFNSFCSNMNIVDSFTCLMNSISFTADWRDPLKEENNQIFMNIDNTVAKVGMLQGKGDFCVEDANFIGFIKNYSENITMPGFSGIVMGVPIFRPYLNIPTISKYSFMALLPKEDLCFDLNEKLINTDLTKLYVNRKKAEKDFLISLPNFKCSYYIDIKEVFEKNNLKDLFTASADFTPMSAAGVKINKVIHKANFDIKAKSEIQIVHPSDNVESTFTDTKNMICFNKPFIYSVINNDTGLPVFVGVLNKIDNNV